MAQPYVGEIRMFAGNFAPAGWMFCDGALLPIAENDILFTVIGTTYGGDGQETFALVITDRVDRHARPLRQLVDAPLRHSTLRPRAPGEPGRRRWI